MTREEWVALKAWRKRPPWERAWLRAMCADADAQLRESGWIIPANTLGEVNHNRRLAGAPSIEQEA